MGTERLDMGKITMELLFERCPFYESDYGVLAF